MVTLNSPSAWLAALLMTLAATSGCSSKGQSATVAAEQLQKSFQKAEPSIAQEVLQAGSAFQASNYTEAILIIDRVVQTQPVNDTQKKAVDALILQTRDAVQRNPKLDSPQLYKAMSDLMVRVHGEN